MALACPEGFRVLIPERAFICNRCDGSWWTGDGRHQCPPIWYVWYPENGETRDDGGYGIHATDVVGAIEKWAVQYDSNADGEIAYRSRLLTVHAQGVDREAQVLVFDIQGMMVPEYTVEQK